MTSNANNNRIIAAAVLALKVDKLELPEDVAQFEKCLAAFDGRSLALLRMATKLMEGKPYSVSSDNPETIRQCYALANALGAPVRSQEQQGNLTSIIFDPPLRQ